MSNKARPCTCDNVPPNGRFVLGYCRACYLYWFDEDYGLKWGRKAGEQLDTNPERKGITIRSLQSNQGNLSFHSSAPNAKPTLHLNRSLPCIHLGNVKDRSSCNCPMKFIHHCDIHQFCHRGSHYSTVASCLTCKDYSPDSPTEG
jgi:hypothetical protein